MHPNGLLFMTTSDQTADRLELYLENGVIYLGVDVGSGRKVGGRCRVDRACVCVCVRVCLSVSICV